MENINNLVIIGAGPAGYTASIYASRYGVSNIIIGKTPGGVAASAHKISNFPTEKAITGRELMDRMLDSATALGAEFIIDEVLSITKQDNLFLLKTLNKKEILAKTILIAIGTKHKKLNIENEDKLFGHGVTYCATCDGPFYKNKIVAVVGGSDAANTTSIYLASIAQKVYQIYRGDKLRGDLLWIDQLEHNDKIKVVYNTNIVKLIGERKLEKLVLDKPLDGSAELAVNGLFIEIGSGPDLLIFKGLGIITNEHGYVAVAPDQSTGVEGIWAAGDITTNSNMYRQIVTACSEGSIAAESIFKYLKMKR